MASEFDHYLSILKASYDYKPQSDDEIAIKEGQILFLKERVDEDWWKVKIKGETQDEDISEGLVPAAYVEPAQPRSTVKVLYDYQAASSGELSVQENEVLYAFGEEEDWLLVQSQKEGSKAGYVPGNYVETVNEDEESLAASQIVVPPSPPRPVSTYVDPADRVASAKVKADDIKTWSVSEVDKKNKRKKGTLGIGNGAVFFASEADKTPVQKWKTGDVQHIITEKVKHVHIEVGGDNPISLHFHAGSRDNAEEIVAKLESSKELAMSNRSTSSSTEAEPPRRLPPIRTEFESRSGKKNGATVHFDSASPAIIPPREPSEDGEEDLPQDQPAHSEVGDEDIAVALYDFTADADDELSVVEGERLVILERDGEDWWKCRNAKGAEGAVPASYLDTMSHSTTRRTISPSPDEEDRKATSEAARLEREAEENRKTEDATRELAEQERKHAEARQRAKAAADEQEHRERQKRKDVAARAASPLAKQLSASTSPESSQTWPTSSSSSSRLSIEKNSRPPPDKTRIWHDSTGQFRVEAAFLGFNNGKLRLHKVNGVIVEVPAEKMSVDDMKYVEKLTSKKRASGRRLSEDDIPLALQRPSGLTSSPPAARGSHSQRKPSTIDWFEFFLSAGCDIDDCTRYASSFERDKMDESLLPDITESTMRSLGLREGDIIRVTKVIEKRYPKKAAGTTTDQMQRDEDMARRLQAEESAASPVKLPPNLFTGPGGMLKAARRGRPQPSKTLPASVDINTIATVSDKIQRTSSPLASSSATASPVAASTTGIQPSPQSTPAFGTIRGFDDDAWTNRPSSTKPIAPTSPPQKSTTARTPSTPPASAAANPQATELSVSMPASAAQSKEVRLAKTTEADIFDQLARLSELRKNQPVASTTVPVVSPPTVTPPLNPQLAVGIMPTTSHNGQPFQGPPGNILTPSPSTVQPAQNQTESRLSQSANGPRGPFAPIPANQNLLQPLIPPQAGFNSFVPTRVNNNPSSQPKQSFFTPQRTGFSAMLPMVAHPTGLPSTGFRQSPFAVPHMNTTTFTPSPTIQQPPPTNVYPSPPSLPTSSSITNNTSPANIFAQMKSGTFAMEHDSSLPQSAEKYDALRPNSQGLAVQATGWNGFHGGYSGYQQ